MLHFLQQSRRLSLTYSLPVILFFLAYQPTSILYSQTWSNVGPLNRSTINKANGQGSGRVKSIAFHPDFGKSSAGEAATTLFTSSIYGGIWISTTNGEYWSNSNSNYPGLNTDTLLSCGIRDLLVKKEKGFLIIYAISYHANGNSLGVIRWQKTTGWKKTGLTYGPLDKKTLYSIYQSPADPDRIFLTSNEGVYATSDQGQKWELILGLQSDSRVRNMAFVPNDKNTMYAFGADVWKSIDGGKNWGSIGYWVHALKHVPTRDTQIFGVCGDSSKLYVTVMYMGLKDKTGKAEDRYYEFLEYSSENWKALPMFGKQIEWHPDRQTLELSPDKKFIFAGQEKVFKYDITKSHWSAITDYGGNMHPDIHDLEFSADGRFWVAHDGGVSICEKDLFTDKPVWKTLSQGLSTACLWSFSVSPRNPNIIFVGEVDNGNSFTENANEPDLKKIVWNGYAMADGGEKLVDHSDSGFIFDRTMMYANSGIGKYRLKNGKVKQVRGIMHNARLAPHLYEDWSTPKPLAQDPKRAKILYRGVNGLLRSTDGGETCEMIFSAPGCGGAEHAQWQSLVTAIEIFPAKTDIVFINVYSPYDTTKIDGVFRTRKASKIPYNDGTGCTDPSSPNCECDYWVDISPNISGYLTTAQKHKSHITCLAVHDKKPSILYAGFTYNPALPKLKVLRWEFNGWTDYSEGIPEWTNVRAIEFQPGTEGTVFIGTDDGIFYRTKAMTKWERFGTGMPNVKVVGLQIVQGVLYAGTYGRGIWKVAMPELVTKKK